MQRDHQSLSSSTSTISDDEKKRQNADECLQRISQVQNIDHENKALQGDCERTHDLLNLITNKTPKDWNNLAVVAENLCAIYFAQASEIAETRYTEARQLVIQSFEMLRNVIKAYINLNDPDHLQEMFQILADRIDVKNRNQMVFICRMWGVVTQKLNGIEDSPIVNSKFFGPILDMVIQPWYRFPNLSQTTANSSTILATDQKGSKSNSSSSNSSNSNFNSILTDFQQDHGILSPIAMLQAIAEMSLPRAPTSRVNAQVNVSLSSSFSSSGTQTLAPVSLPTNSDQQQLTTATINLVNKPTHVPSAVGVFATSTGTTTSYQSFSAVTSASSSQMTIEAKNNATTSPYNPSEMSRLELSPQTNQANISSYSSSRPTTSLSQRRDVGDENNSKIGSTPVNQDIKADGQNHTASANSHEEASTTNQPHQLATNTQGLFALSPWTRFNGDDNETKTTASTSPPVSTNSTPHT
jgi:hypothetical protein